MLVLSLVLAEGRVALEQFVQHAAETEPIGRGVVAGAFGQHFWCHVAVGPTENEVDYCRVNINNRKGHQLV